MEFECFREEEFRTGKSPDDAWIVVLREDSARHDEKVRLVRLNARTGEAMGRFVASLVKTNMMRPLMLSAGDLGGVPHMGIDGVECALVMGSETTSCANSMATDLVDWADLFGRNDSCDTWNWCFAVTGEAVLVKRKKEGKLCPFSRMEALAVAADVLPEIETAER